MEIKKEIGCYSSTLDIDGRDFDSFDDGLKRHIGAKIFNWILDNNHLKWFIDSVVEFHGYCEMDNEPCEECGNFGETYKLEI